MTKRDFSRPGLRRARATSIEADDATSVGASSFAATNWARQREARHKAELSRLAAEFVAKNPNAVRRPKPKA